MDTCVTFKSIFPILSSVPSSPLMRVKSPVRSHTPNTLHTDHSHYALFTQVDKKREGRNDGRRGDGEEMHGNQWEGDEGGEEILG